MTSLVNLCTHMLKRIKISTVYILVMLCTVFQILQKGEQQQSTCFVLQQLLDLNRLQLTEGSNSSPLIRGQEKTDTSLLTHQTVKKFGENLDQPLQQTEGIRADLQQRVSPPQEMKSDDLPFRFSQLENSPSSATAGLPLHGESFWQCKSPEKSSQV